MESPPDLRLKPPCDPDDALEVLKRLHESGHIAYFAGGCVRDTLLGLKPKDWDVATDAEPNRVRSLFPNTQAVGAAFGVILVRHRQSVIEVATFRADGTYEDGRRPSSVRFTTAEEDAQRRDFTINGLFLDPLENRVIDYVGGQDDLRAKVLRAIGQPHERFSEDHLRLLRAVRFAARFSLTIDPATASAIESAAPRLKGISPERIGDEIRLMLTPVTRPAAWKLLWQLRLAQQVFRFLKLPDHPIDHSKSILLRITPVKPISTGLALAGGYLTIQQQVDSAADLRIHLGKSPVSRAVHAMRQSLRISNDESEEMARILEGIAPLLADQPSTVAQKKRFLAQPTAPLSRDLMEAMAEAGVQTDRIAQLRAELREFDGKDVAPIPLITGDDLIAAGFSPGPKFKQILDAVYDSQLEGRISTQQQALYLARELGA